MKPAEGNLSPAWPVVLLPGVIAQSVCDEASQFLDVELPARLADWLTAKAERCFQRNRRFRSLMQGRGNAPRDWLRVFMRHWLSALLGTERPDLWYCLPPAFDLGHALPPGSHPRVNRRGRGPLPGPCAWRPARALEQPPWRFLRPARRAAAARVRRPRRPPIVQPPAAPERSAEPLGPFRLAEWPVLA
jgi:hypothetical protein